MPGRVHRDGDGGRGPQPPPVQHKRRHTRGLQGERLSIVVLVELNQPFVLLVKILETGSRVAKGLEFSWKSWTNIGVLIAFLQEVS